MSVTNPIYIPPIYIPITDNNENLIRSLCLVARITKRKTMSGK
jgi:hypothetical protein